MSYRVAISILEYFTVKSSKSRGHFPIDLESPLLRLTRPIVKYLRAVLNKELSESASSRQNGKKPWVYSPHKRSELGKLAVPLRKQ